MVRVRRSFSSVDGCPFCTKNWANLEILEHRHDTAVISPLGPVTDGHVLVIHKQHTNDAAVDASVAAELMYTASMWTMERGIHANIITSIGGPASQTIRHTPLHVVPRRIRDGLQLPWPQRQLWAESPS